MGNYIIFNGINSNTIKGLLISELPSIYKPKVNYDEIKVDGRDGSIINENNYLPYTKKLKIGLRDNYDINEVISYFNGNGEMVFSNEPDKIYNVNILNDIEFVRLGRFRTATIDIYCQPFKYKYNEQPLVINKANATITNVGNHISKPLIKIKGSTKITFKINGLTCFEYDFKNDNEVIIDCEQQDAYLEETLKNRQMNGNFPIFKIGENVISVDGNIQEMKISKYSRWL